MYYTMDSAARVWSEFRDEAQELGVRWMAGRDATVGVGGAPNSILRPIPRHVPWMTV